MNGLEGKVVLVTAAAGAGIGQAVARRFALEGARVVVTGSGAIVNVSSPASYNGGLAGEGAYSAAKAALQSMTRTVAIEGGPRGVRCNAVAPGIVWNDFGNLLRLCPQEFWDQKRKEIPMGRFGRPEEVAGVVAFLASDDASYVSGETIVIGGGGWLQP